MKDQLQIVSEIIDQLMLVKKSHDDLISVAYEEIKIKIKELEEIENDE